MESAAHLVGIGPAEFPDISVERQETRWQAELFDTIDGRQGIRLRLDHQSKGHRRKRIVRRCPEVRQGGGDPARGEHSSTKCSLKKNPPAHSSLSLVSRRNPSFAPNGRRG